MWLSLLGILLGLLGLGIAVIRFYEDIHLRDKQKLSLQKRFEDWWLRVSYQDERALAVALASRFSRSLDTYFGERLFSVFAFKKSLWLSSCVVVLTVGVSGIGSDRFVDIKPWQNYRESISSLRKVWSEERIQSEEKQETRELLQRWAKAAERFDSLGWAIFYTVVSLAILLLLTGLLFFASLAFSRQILREIIIARRVFTTISLLICNCALTLPLWLFVYLLVCILFQPWLWLCIPLAYVAATTSIYLIATMVAGGSILSLAFGSATLKAVTLSGFLPCLMAILTTIFSGLLLRNRKLFHALVSYVLDKCADKGPLRVITTLLACFGAVLTLVTAIIRASISN